MGGAVSDPDWKDELRWTVEAFTATDFRGHPVAPPEVQGVASRYLMGAVMPHIEAAYRRGREAGGSRAGYRLVLENERLRKELARYEREEKCATAPAPSAGSPSPASTTEAGP